MIRPAFATVAAESWFARAMTSELMLVCAVVFVASAAALVLVVRAMVRLGRAQRAIRSPLLRDEAGTTSIEFALVFPILLFLSLLLVQTMMLMAGNLYVHYAAFRATRAAAIEIPQDYTDIGGLPANTYADRGDKHDRIRQAAFLSLLPVAGRLEGGSGLGYDVQNAVNTFYTAYGREAPAWVEAMVAEKVAYAADNTEIEVLETRVTDEDTVEFHPLPFGEHRFGARDPITVQLVHRLNLGVPFVSRIFADGDNDARGPGRYTEVVARFTLTNEGVPVPLPEKPEIERLTPELPQLDQENEERWRRMNQGDDLFPLVP